MTRFTLYFDGSCEPNPNGFASIGVYIPDLDIRISRAIGEGDGMTNNIAEYEAILCGLREIRDHVTSGDELLIFGDSNLVIKQLNGHYRVKAPNLKSIHGQCKEIIDELRKNNIIVILEQVGRELNGVADELSHRPLEDRPGVKEYGMCECGGIFVPREGKYGRFLGCSHYPKCRKTKQLQG